MKNPSFVSPFSWRYGSLEMREVWEEVEYRRLWRKIWVALATVQSEFGVFDESIVAQMEANIDRVDFEKALSLEGTIRHDLFAELLVFSEQSSDAGKVIHAGATSSDIRDNADILRMITSLKILRRKLIVLLTDLIRVSKTLIECETVGFTHFQVAEPTTFGYRFAWHVQDLFEDLKSVDHLISVIRGKGIRGAVGTNAALIELIGEQNIVSFEERLSQKLGLNFFDIVSQIYPRKQDFTVLSTLASMGGSLSKFSLDIRLLANPLLGEVTLLSEKEQVGSSTMPFKNNPIDLEKISSLTRLLSAYSDVAWNNFGQNILERSLDDSANRRVILAESFLVADEIIDTSIHVINTIRVDASKARENIQRFWPIQATEKLIVHLVKSGANRQEAHLYVKTKLDSISRSPSVSVCMNLFLNDKYISEFLNEETVRSVFGTQTYIGDVKERTKKYLIAVDEAIQNISSKVGAI